jgi:hypothetical protein
MPSMPEEFEVEILQAEIDRIREEMQPGGRYAFSFPRGYAAARLSGFQSYLNQTATGDVPPGVSGTYRSKIGLIRQGRSPKDVAETSEAQPPAWTLSRALSASAVPPVSIFHAVRRKRC